MAVGRTEKLPDVVGLTKKTGNMGGRPRGQNGSIECEAGQSNARTESTPGKAATLVNTGGAGRPATTANTRESRDESETMHARTVGRCTPTSDVKQRRCPIPEIGRCSTGLPSTVPMSLHHEACKSGEQPKRSSRKKRGSLIRHREGILSRRTSRQIRLRLGMPIRRITGESQRSRKKQLGGPPRSVSCTSRRGRMTSLQKRGWF